MKYQKLALMTILTCISVAASFFLANAVLDYLTAGGKKVSSAVHDAVVLIAILAPAVLMLPRIRSEAEAIKNKPAQDGK